MHPSVREASSQKSESFALYKAIDTHNQASFEIEALELDLKSQAEFNELYKLDLEFKLEK